MKLNPRTDSRKTTVRHANERLAKTGSGLGGKMKRNIDLTLLGAVTAVFVSEIGGRESELPRPVAGSAPKEI